MPDDSRGVRTLAEALRGWPDDELQAAATGTLPDYAEAARREQQRRARPCTCFVPGSVSHERYRQALRECRRHEGWPG